METSSRKSVPPSAISRRPCFVSAAPVKAPLHVAEKLALDNALGEARAIDDHEVLLLSPAVAVDGAGHQLFACAAFPVDEHGGIGGRDALHQPGDLFHRRAFADHVVELELAAQLFAQVPVLRDQPPVVEGPPTVVEARRG